MRIHDRLIYVDTSMWNRLYDAGVEAGALIPRLVEVKASPAVGDHAVHELAKTFTSTRKRAADRAAALCSYLRDFVDAGVPLIKPNWALMIEEALHVVGDAGPPEILLDESRRAFLRSRLDDLKAGIVAPEIAEEMRRRVWASQDHTASLREVLARERGLSGDLRKIGNGQLKRWIDDQTTESIGVQALQINLRTQFPQNDGEELWEVARRLLDRPFYRVSRALARTTLYSLWRCGNFGTVPGDFNDDLLHLTNASYCEFFATSDPQHARQRAEVFDTCRHVTCTSPDSLVGQLACAITESSN